MYFKSLKELLYLKRWKFDKSFYRSLYNCDPVTIVIYRPRNGEIIKQLIILSH